MSANGRPVRPNILLLFSDEHRFDFMGHAGHPVVRTPFLDWLAQTGTSFTNAYTPSPVCIPARQAMAAGQYCHRCGVKRYGEDLPPFSRTFARWFSEHGYMTTACGKLHHEGEDQMQGWLQRIGMDMVVNPGRVARPGSLPAPPERLQGPQQERGRLKWDDVKEIKRAGIGRGEATHVVDDFAEAGARQFLDKWFLSAEYDRPAPADFPLMLYVGFNNPHYPYFAEREAFEYYLARVEPFVDEAMDHPVLGRCPSFPGPVRVGPEGDVGWREAQRATAAYCANIERIDRQYAGLAERMRFLGQDLDDWIIIYASDHGEMLGEHGIWEKKRFYEASARVPLIVRWPKGGIPGGGRVERNVNLVDLFSTLTDLAGVPEASGLDSRSFAPLLADPAAPWNDETLSEYNGQHVMIKRGALKYQCYGPDIPEVLFDLAVDPGEAVNAIDDPTHAEAVAAFRGRAAELGYEAPRRA